MKSPSCAVYGSVFFATAPLIEEQLPVVTDDTRNAVVILGLRGGVGLGSTFLEVLERYADLREHNSKLMLASVTEEVESQLKETGIAQTIGRDNIFLQTEKMVKRLARPGMPLRSGWQSSRRRPFPRMPTPREKIQRRRHQAWTTMPVSEADSRTWCRFGTTEVINRSSDRGRSDLDPGFSRAWYARQDG